MSTKVLIVLTKPTFFIFQFLYDSEKSKKEEDILKDIEKGIRLKHVKTNDRSKPNLRGNINIESKTVCKK